MSAQPLQPGRPSNSLHFIVGEMSGKLDQVLLAVLDDRKQVAQRFDEQDIRITALERWRWKIIGGVSIVVFLGGTVETLLNVKR